jgi:hypothetical protein
MQRLHILRSTQKSKTDPHEKAHTKLTEPGLPISVLKPRGTDKLNLNSIRSAPLILIYPIQNLILQPAL